MNKIKEEVLKDLDFYLRSHPIIRKILFGDVKTVIPLNNIIELLIDKTLAKLQDSKAVSNRSCCDTCGYPLGKIEGLRGVICFKCNFRKAMDLGKNKAEKENNRCSKCGVILSLPCFNDVLQCVDCVEQEHKATIDKIKNMVNNIPLYPPDGGYLINTGTFKGIVLKELEKLKGG